MKINITLQDKNKLTNKTTTKNENKTTTLKEHNIKITISIQKIEIIIKGKININVKINIKQ